MFVLFVLGDVAQLMLVISDVELVWDCGGECPALGTHTLRCLGMGYHECPPSFWMVGKSEVCACVCVEREREGDIQSQPATHTHTQRWRGRGEMFTVGHLSHSMRLDTSPDKNAGIDGKEQNRHRKAINPD